MVGFRHWLEQQGLGNYADLLAEHEVDFEVLPELEEADLEKIGIALGPRKKLLKAIRRLQASPDGIPTRETTARAAPGGEAERRQLTVMFADLVGSTELSRRLDPEDLRDINRAYQDAATAAIEDYDGYVARYMGDGVLAYFGYPRAHEDDAERAVRAGLGLARAIAELDTGVSLAARVGIATGPVVVGDIIGEGAAQESTVVGETPNLAARLESVAEPGAVVVSEATRYLVGGRFDLEALEPQNLKGIDDPVQAYRAVGVRDVSRFDATLERRLTPLIGRDEELRILLRRWDLAVEGEGQIVLLSGEAGVGKSRIVRALQDSLEVTSISRILCYCSPYRQTSAFHPLIDQLERAARIGSEQTPAEKLKALNTLLASLGLDAERVTPYFGELLSIPSEGIYPSLDLTPDQLRARTLELMVEAVEAMTRRAPVLFMLEDMHWIDPSTQDFLTRLIEAIRDKRALVVVTHRPGHRTVWGEYSHVTALSLNNLGRRDSTAMVAEVAGGWRLPEDLVEAIVSRTDGVPLFIEEVTAACMEAGSPSEGGHASDPAAASAAGIPATLQDLLMERLDRLGPAKEVAQIAAVIGRTFTFNLLSAVAEQGHEALERRLSDLLRTGLVHGGARSRSAYEFKHALVRDAAYQSLLKRERQRIHLRIAKHLGSGIEGNPPLELVAHHFQEGGQPDEGARHWRMAGEQALGRFAHVEAIDDLRHALAALELLPEDDEWMRFELETQILLGPSLMYVLGQGASEVEQTYARALDLAERLGDPWKSFTSAWGLWRLQFARGDMTSGFELASKCRKVSGRSDDEVMRLGAAFALGATNLFNGRCADAAPHLETSIATYRRMEDKSRLAVFGQDPGLSSLAYLAWARWLLGLPDQAVTLAEEAVRLARDTGKPALVGIATGFAGLTHLIRRDIPNLISYAEECKSICDRHEFRQHGAMSNVILGYAHSYQGDHERAIFLVENGMNEKLALHNFIGLPWFFYMTAETYLAAGQLERALEAARNGIDYASKGEERFFESENHRMQGVILIRTPGASRQIIESHFDEAARLARDQKAKSLELRVAVSRARFELDRDARGRARELLEPIYRTFTEGFDTLDLQEAGALLEDLT